MNAEISIEFHEFFIPSKIPFQLQNIHKLWKFPSKWQSCILLRILAFYYYQIQYTRQARNIYWNVLTMEPLQGVENDIARKNYVI